MKFQKIFFLIFFLLYAVNVFSEKTITLSYYDFVSEVLKKDLNIQSYILNKNIAKLNIERYLANFDPYFSTSFDKSFQKEFTGSKLQNNISDFVINKNVDFNVSLSKKFITGTDITLSFTNNRFKTNSDWALLNPMYSSTLLLNVSQPLLKGFGIRINKNEILKAENSLHKTELDIKNLINSEILKASENYFEIVYAYKYFLAKKESLQLAKNTLKINIKKVKLGLLPKTVINETEAEVESREEDFIKAQQNIFNEEDKLKIYLNCVRSQYHIKPSTDFLNENVNMTLEEAIDYALKNRYELKKLDQDIKNAELDVIKTENSLKPDLNFNIYGGISGKGDSYHSNINRLKTNHYHNWGVGLKFSYPIFNRNAKADYKISKIYKEQLEIERKKLENSIIVQVKKSFRNLQTLKKRIEANFKALQSAYEKMKTEEKKYQNKLSTVFRVFSYQSDYIAQKVKLIRAKTDFSEEVLNFYNTIGKNLYLLKTEAK